MPVIARSANLEVDSKLIIDFLAENHFVESNEKRFDWLYRSGPDGEARAVIAQDSATRNVIGVASAFPRSIFIRDKPERGWVLGDFCVASGHRSLGPATQLQRACLESIRSESGAPYYYDFPSEAMSVIYQRLGIPQGPSMVRLAKPLRVDRKVRSVVKHSRLAGMLSAPLNAAMAWSVGNDELPAGSVVALQKSACGSEFTRLADQMGPTLGICVRRSAQYLNWRYLNHPFRHHEIFTMHNNDLLRGYAVVSEGDGHLHLVDLFGSVEAVTMLVRSVISYAQQRNLESVTTAILGTHSWVKMLRDLGFHEREKYAVVIGQHSQSTEANWLLMNGDRES